MTFLDKTIICENGIVPILPHIRKYLSLFGFLPDKLTLYTIFKACFVMFVFASVIIGLTGHIYYVFNCDDIDEISYADLADDFAGTMSAFTCYFVVLSATYYSPEILKALDQYGDFRNFDMPHDFEKIATNLERCSIVITTFFCFGGFGTFFLLLLEGLIKCEDGVVSVCGLVISGYLPFVDISYAPMRQIWMCVQCLSFLGAWSACSTVWILCSLSEFLIVYMRHLSQMFLKTKILKTTGEQREHVKLCIQYHHKIIKLHVIIKKLGELCMMVYDTSCSVSISLSLYQFIFLEQRFQTLFHFISFVIFTGILSVVGEHLILENENLANTVYDGIPWDGDVKIIQDYYLVLMRIHRPMVLPSGKFGALGHVKFSELVKRSYSFLTLMAEV